MNAPLVSTRNLQRRYPGVRALDNVSIDIGRGEVIGLVGKNGAGKSTLIRILAGIEKPDAGQLLINGELMPPSYGTSMAHRCGLAFMHQELANAPEMTVAENVAFGTPFPKRFGVLIDWTELARRVSTVLARLDPAILPHHRVGDLTMVQQRMVMIGRALYQDARLLVLDEPSTSLTETEIAQLHRIVRQMREEGRTVIYVSHRLREIVDITDRVIVMQDGRVMLETSTADTDEKSIVAAIAGRTAKDAPANPSARRQRNSAFDGETIMTVRGLSRSSVVHDISFELKAGEILGIAGLVGSGRTELVRLIAGADRATSGSIELMGKAMRLGSPRDAVKAGVVLLPEDRRHQGLVLGMSVRENMTIASLKHHRASGLPFISRKRERETANRLIDKLSVKTPGPEQTVRLLSGGNQQKVVLAKWMTQDNRVFIFDEPTQGVDVHGKQEMFDLIRSVVTGNRSAIVISSDFSELVSLSDRVVVLREGRLVGELGGEDVSEQTIVELVYASDETAHELEKTM
ncbi:sugar ABC transporter ATP-binding protein [Agrobacterium rubi]|uniref:sugar ABC transporter ATP-binding protein n=1 Tax=Agrobacterium rubi TaxID=28099 RepID=UPI00157369BE|nr:sugar ABC transporter ATP-binding protein [Agrobacterium rubi]NTF08930.1 sugar ABC transporter ATP-binding protein [Agrobacterium rubi]NTF21201.1 sugar ABC transporter ATP-binding protein [Agrobacterium rubi]NTF28058.1 sugar ABC transporter ATP-binding protein [Agrobacterium rubi]